MAMRPKPALLALLAALALAATSFSVGQEPTTSAAAGIQLKVEKIDVREALRSIFKQANISYTIAPEVKGSVSADFRGLVIEDAVSVLVRQVNAVVRVEGGVYQVMPFDESPRVVILDGPIAGSKQVLRSEAQVTFASADDKFLYFLRDDSVMKVDKATMTTVATLPLGGRRIRISF
jgi:type II secretory pathway component GspD/PulD (secretin)